MCNFKNRGMDKSVKKYRIAKAPRLTAQRNIDSWQKIEKHMNPHSKNLFTCWH